MIGPLFSGRCAKLIKKLGFKFQ